MRVSSVFASAIHSAYSRLWLGGNAANAACAFLFVLSAAVSAGGMTSGFGARLGCLRLTMPASFNAAAFLTYAASVFFDGRSAIFVILPKFPIAISDRSPTTSEYFQNPKVACCLNAPMPHRIPLYMKAGMLHFRASSTSGTAACTTSRMCVRIGLAKSADFAM